MDIVNQYNGDKSYVDQDFVDIVQIRNNSKEIVDKFSRVSKEKISNYMDYCIDEEAIDALVSLGGDPSCFNIRSRLNCVDKSRTFVRRLYHGISEVPMDFLEDAYISLTNINTTVDSNRNSKYADIENEKFEYWSEKYPNTVKKTNEYGKFKYSVDPHDIISIDRNVKRICLIHPKTVDDGGIMKSIWFHLEIEFGEYHRFLKATILNC